MSSTTENQNRLVESNILDFDATRLAKRIRHERLARSWSLDEMAERSGVSRAMIHRIESCTSSPTAALLGKISGAFRISMPSLLRQVPDELGVRVARAKDRTSWQDPETGYVREQINSVARKNELRQHTPEITRVTLPPGARVPFPQSAFEFIAQAIWVLKGSLHFIEGETTHRLGPDDCLMLGEPQDCQFENRSDLPCVYIVIVC